MLTLLQKLINFHPQIKLPPYSFNCYVLCWTVKGGSVADVSHGAETVLKRSIQCNVC